MNDNRDTIFFRYKVHPGDLLRNNSVQKLPDPISEQEDFWVWFLPNYQNDETISYLNDLYKIKGDCFQNEQEKRDFETIYGKINQFELDNKIQDIEQQLTFESFRNFYSLVLNGKLDIIINHEKQ